MRSPMEQPVIANRRRQFNIALVVLSLSAVLLYLFTTKDGGLGVTPDSLHYLAASKSLLAGDVLTRFWWTVPYTSWPPLYPILLAGLNILARFLNIDILEAVRLAHAIFVGLIIFLSGCLFWRYLRSSLLIIMGIVSIILASPIILVSLNVWNETFYILLSLIFLWYLPTFLEERRIYQFVVLVILAALGTLQRYASVSIIPFGMLSIALFLQNTHWVKRWAIGAAFAVSAIPYVLWLMYIRSLGIPTIGPSADPFAEMLQNFAVTPNLLSQLFLPLDARTPLVIGGLIIGLLIALTYGFVTYFYDKPDGTRGTILKTSPILIALYVLVYMIFYYVSHLLIYSLNIDMRHLSVMVPFIMLLVFFGLDRIAARLTQVRWRYAAFVALISVWFIYPASLAGELLLLRQYACCHGTLLYRHLPMMEWLNEHRLPGRYFSNTPIPLFYTLLPVYSGTLMTSDMNLWMNTALASDDEDTYLIWFRDARNLFFQGADRFYYDYDPENALPGVVDFELIASFDEGSVYRIRSKN
jgi:hypothetical protein